MRHLSFTVSRDRARPKVAAGEGRWPTFLIIGAHKAGTTSLYRYLDAHPEIRLSSQKELCYFSGPVSRPTLVSQWGRGPEWYRGNFVGKAPAHGEASTVYTNYPHTTGVPQRIHEAIPDVKLIYAVRDPVDRMVSHYMHVRGLGRERRSLSDILRSPRLTSSAYLLRSCYWLQLQQYLAWFEPSQILVVPFGQLVRERRRTLSRVFRFLGVADDFVSPDWERVHNPAQRYPLLEALGKVLDEPTIMALSGKRGIGRILGTLRAPQRDKPAVADRLWTPAKRIVAADAEQLRAFTGQPLEDWSV
jgi:Sulfotransferase family